MLPSQNKRTSSHPLDLMINGFRLTPLLFVVAKLGIANLLHQQPQTGAELAARCGVNAQALQRVLRTLSSQGIFTENGQGQFELTELAQALRADVENSLHSAALMWGYPCMWASYGHLLHAVETGQPAFDHLYGMPSFDYFGQHPEAAAVFNNYMSERTGRDVQRIAAAYDFSEAKTIVDLGGGQGTMLVAILQANPEAQGILFELAPVLPQARQKLAAAGLLTRCQTVAGNFFHEPIPDSADLYLLKWVIHDWDDDKAIAILRNCRRYIPAGARLLLIEQILRPENPEAYRTDIAMLLMTGGRERTEAEYQTLLAAAGFVLTRIQPTASAFDIIEAKPA